MGNTPHKRVSGFPPLSPDFGPGEGEGAGEFWLTKCMIIPQKGTSLIMPYPTKN
jgi:hypothetical protein